MTGRVHIVRSASQHYRLMFVPGGPDRHLFLGEHALRDFLLTDLDVPLGTTETALDELRTRGRHTIEDILVTDKIQKFWRLDTTPKPTAPEAKPMAPALSKPAKRKPAPNRTTSKTRQTQISEEGETEEAFGPMSSRMS